MTACWLPVAYLCLSFVTVRSFVLLDGLHCLFRVRIAYQQSVGKIHNQQSTNDNDNGVVQDNHHGLTRRKFIWNPTIAAAIASATFDVPSAYADQGESVGTSTTVTALRQPKLPYSTTRQYRWITLANGLRVLLVSDKQAIRTSAALSIAGAGQFSDPEELPGCAHLMEHMILSFQSFSPFRKSLDFEEWLSNVDGASNAFTGYEQVCFHFTSPPGVFAEALFRFSSLFNEADVYNVCQNEEVLKREIRRVSSELDFESETIQSFYLMKDMMNPEHPYSRFARGNIETLERNAKEAGIDVGKRLFQFYQEFYQPNRADLVVVGPTESNLLERWVLPFSGTLSRKAASAVTRTFPTPLKRSTKMRQFILYRPRVDFPLKANIETMSLHWPLELDYCEPNKLGRTVVTATQVGFVISQFLGRRGPGSFYFILNRKKWVPPGMQGVPRVTFPVDVSGFQLMKLEINLTLEGFVNRAAVVAYISRAIKSVFSDGSMKKFLLSRQILSQIAVTAQLHGHVLAPRPPDAIELATDSLMVVERQKINDPGEWSRFPLSTDRIELAALQKVVRDIFVQMNPANSVIITTATDGALNKAKDRGILGETVPFAPKWQSSPSTGAKYYRDDLLVFSGFVGELFSANVEDDELLPPLVNNLIPPMLRPPRVWQQSINRKESKNDNWRILESDDGLPLPIPRMAPEPSCRCAFVFQLLSPRPARANTRQAAYAELWKVSFEKSISDLAELGAPAGLAYDLSFNKYGMRIAFLGISQNIASYARRFCRRLAKHQRKLLDGPELLDVSIIEIASNDAIRTPGLSAVRKREIERILKATTAYESATEAIAFFKSCRGGCAFAQGDLPPNEVSALFGDLQTIFKPVLGSLGKSDETSTPIPSIDGLNYKPTWKPRFGSSCSVTGVSLISDACGRVPR